MVIDLLRSLKTSPSAAAQIAPAQGDPARFADRGVTSAVASQGANVPRGPTGPKYYLSVSHPGLRPQMDYVPQESYAQTAELLANYHRAREILEAICEINRELLRRREAL